MSSLVLNRINRQLEKKEEVKEVREVPQEKEIPLSPPIPPDELKKIFMSELAAPEQTVTEEKQDCVFDGIENFVNWYLPVKDKFTENQIIPLTTLVQARDMINVGCGCKRVSRSRQANEYYKTFWLNNQATDLPQKVLEVGNFKSVGFASEGSVFIRFPLGGVSVTQ